MTVPSTQASISNTEGLASIVNSWASLVGSEVAKATRPLAIQGETLVIESLSSAWSHQLTFLESELLASIALISADSCVKRLRFRIVPKLNSSSSASRVQRFEGAQTIVADPRG